MATKEEKFNKWFSAFILLGMTAALLITTSIKFASADDGRWLLVLAAFGSLMGILATVASASGKIITFLFGLLDVSIYGAMCLMNWHDGGSGLGNAILHFVYFVPMQFVGFHEWRKRSSSETSAVQARRLSWSSRGWLLLGLLAVAVVLYFIIARFDKSAADTMIKVAVVLDVLPLVCNLFGQMLMSMAYMEQWILWMGVNVFSILMWSRTLSMDGGTYAAIYVIKYSFYLINSINGLRIWLKLSSKDA